MQEQEAKAKANESEANDEINVEASAADYLDPAVNVMETEHLPKISTVVGPISPEALAVSAEDKRKFYDEQNKAREQDLSRSALDAGQESVMTPPALEEMKRAQAEAKQKLIERQQEAAAEQTEVIQGQQAEARKNEQEYQAQAQPASSQKQAAPVQKQEEKRSLADKIMHPTKK